MPGKGRTDITRVPHFHFASKGLVESGKQKDKMLKALQVSLSLFYPVNVQVQFQNNVLELKPT